MKKNILLLINGFGVERADSYNIYSGELMPNMDRLTKERVFASIPNNYLDYVSAYRNFSMGINEPLTYSVIENNINNETLNNELLNNIANEVNNLNSRLQIICYWDSTSTIDHLVAYLRTIQTLTKAKIYLHIILCQKSLNDYKDIDRGFQILNYELGPNVKLGVVVGENYIKSMLGMKEYVKCIITEAGEKWKDLDKKVQVLIQTKTKPFDTRTFSVNMDYKFEENDQVLFFNYSNVEIDRFLQELNEQKYRTLNLDTIKYYSLFPLKCTLKQVPFMYNYAVSSNYMLNSIKSINAKCIVMDKKENCANINYYFTGQRNIIDEDLKFLPTDDGFIYDPNKMLEVVKSCNKDLIIINYEINTCKTIEEIKERLTKIDAIIGVLDTYIRENHYSMFITSLYGLQVDLYNQKQELCKVNFSGKVPLIIDDEVINLAQFTVSEGSLYDLANSIYQNINNDYKITGLIKRKSSLLSFLYKKPKEEKK